MRAYIIDDELPAREELAWLLRQCQPVGGRPIEVVGQADGAEAAFEALAEEPVDVAFVDIDMPGLGGMRLAEMWTAARGAAPGPLVVFVTAYEEHAVEAFAVDAVDYLLKPVRLGRLQQALERVQARLEARMIRTSPAEATADGLHTGPGPSPRPLQRISVEEAGVYRVIPVEDILFCEAGEGIVVVQTRHKRFITDFSLKFLEQNLDPARFFRSHRSYLVQLDAIESIAPWGAGTYRLIFSREGDLGVPLARSRAAELKSLIPWSASVFESEP